MSAMLPMAVYGLEVPAGDIPIPAKSDIPSAFRITMAAIDPSAEPEGEAGAPPRATLKIIRQSLDYDDEDDEDEEFDIEEMERMLAEEEDDDDEDSDDEDLNGGPSDPAKSKKARKEAAQKEIQRVLEEEEDDDDELPNGVNGTKMSLKALGKMPASDESEDDEDDDDSDIVAGEWEEFVICTLDPNQVSPNIPTARNTFSNYPIALQSATRHHCRRARARALQGIWHTFHLPYWQLR